MNECNSDHIHIILYYCNCADLYILFGMSHHHSQDDKASSSEKSLFLDQPRTEKQTDGDQSFGFASMQEWRKTNEDFHKH